MREGILPGEQPGDTAGVKGTSDGSLVDRFLRRAPAQARSRALVQAVLTAVEDVLGRGPGEEDGFTLDGVLERAGVGVSSFHQYFGDKRSLLGAFIGHLTERNFVALSGALRAQREETLEETVDAVARLIVDTYLSRPAVTRAAARAIGRLGLLPQVLHEQDRFAAELATRAAVFYEDVPREQLVRSLELVADAVIGVVIGELERAPTPDRDRCRADLAQLGLAVLVARHGPPRAANTA